MWSRFLENKSRLVKTPRARKLKNVPEVNLECEKSNVELELKQNEPFESCDREQPQEIPADKISPTEEAVALIKRLQETKSPRGINAKDQVDILRRCEHELQRQLIRVSAEAEATQKVVDVLVETSEEVKLEKEALRVVSHSAMNAAEEILVISNNRIMDSTAQCIVWKSIATALMQIP